MIRPLSDQRHGGMRRYARQLPGPAPTFVYFILGRRLRTRSVENRMITKAILLTCLAGLTSCSVKESSDETWSQPVNGIQASLTLRRSEVVNDTPIISAYLTLRNVSDVANPIRINWAATKITFSVVDENGVAVPQSRGVYDGISVDLSDLVLPFESTLTFNISQRGSGIPHGAGALIDLGPSDCWVVAKQSGKKYFLSAVLDVSEHAERIKEYERPWKGRIEVPKALIPFG